MTTTALATTNFTIIYDITPPIINSLIGSVTTTTATIAWNTNENTNASIIYGTNSSNLSLNSSNSSSSSSSSSTSNPWPGPFYEPRLYVYSYLSYGFVVKFENVPEEVGATSVPPDILTEPLMSRVVVPVEAVNVPPLISNKPPVVPAAPIVTF